MARVAGSCPQVQKPIKYGAPQVLRILLFIALNTQQQPFTGRASALLIEQLCICKFSFGCGSGQTLNFSPPQNLHSHRCLVNNTFVTAASARARAPPSLPRRRCRLYEASRERLIGLRLFGPFSTFHGDDPKYAHHRVTD